MDRDISRLKDILNRSNYTVAVCGSGMAAESGFLGFKMAERAYEIERAYGAEESAQGLTGTVLAYDGAGL